MNTFFLKATWFSLVMGMIATTGLFAQNNPNTYSSSASTPSKTTATSTKQTPAKTGKTTTRKEESKEQWLKHYNDMKSRIDALSSKAKTETKNPDLTAEVTKLNKMAEDFKDKLDDWDKISADKRAAFNSDLHSAHKALDEQYEKTKHMWDKQHPASKTKAAPAKEAPKQ